MGARSGTRVDLEPQARCVRSPGVPEMNIRGDASLPRTLSHRHPFMRSSLVRCVSLVSISLAFAAPIRAATYYADSLEGSDAASGTLAQPWRTLGTSLPKLSPGDTLVLMSDGLPELFSETGEMFGYNQPVATLREVAHGGVEEILQHFVETVTTWAGLRPPDDDVTFVVLKVRDRNGAGPDTYC